MHIEAHLDVDVVAVETDDQVSVLVELTAPTPPLDEDQPRPARTLQVVLDRSGSMGGGRLDGAITALQGIVDRLDPADNFGVVAFDNEVEMIVPTRPLADKQSARRAIGGLYARGGTDLSAGYLRGLQEARRVAGQAGATALLISDGHANAGMTDPDSLTKVAANAYRHGVITSTLGYGLGYDEVVMSAIAGGGSGNELFAEEPDTAMALIAGEVEGLLAQTTQAGSLLIRPSAPVQAVHVMNDLPVTAAKDGVVAELGSFYANETRKLLLVFDVPAVAALGLVTIATLEFSYVELPTLKQHSVFVPIQVNVVPGDHAAGRVPDPVVRTELLYQQAQQAKRRASAHLSSGDSEAALLELGAAQEAMKKALAEDLPSSLAGDIAEEVETLAYLAQEAEHGMISRAAKYSSMDHNYKSTKRGRQRPPRPQTPSNKAADSD